MKYELTVFTDSNNSEPLPILIQIIKTSENKVQNKVYITLKNPDRKISISLKDFVQIAEMEMK